MNGECDGEVLGTDAPDSDHLQFRTVWVNEGSGKTDSAAPAALAVTPTSGWSCPRCGASRPDAFSLALHMAQCPAAAAAASSTSSPQPQPPADSRVRYRYVRVLQKDPLNAANQSVTLIPLVEDRPFSCSTCSRGFSSLGGLRKHARTHSGGGGHPCPHPGCGRTFPLPSHLRRHMWVHTDVRPHSCDLCPPGRQGFLTSTALRLHRMSHTGERPHQCSVCGKAFRTASYLSIHFRMHTGERPFVCPFEGCGKGFARRCNLRAHLVSHTRERPHACWGCTLRFQFRKQMERHAKECQLAKAVGASVYSKKQEVEQSGTTAPSMNLDSAEKIDRTCCSQLELSFDSNGALEGKTSIAPEYIDIETFGALQFAFAANPPSNNQTIQNNPAYTIKRNEKFHVQDSHLSHSHSPFYDNKFAVVLS